MGSHAALPRQVSCRILLPISLTFYRQILRWFPFTKILQIQTVITGKLWKTRLFKKLHVKMLVKLTPGWNGVDGGVRYFGDSDSCRRGDWSTRGFRPTLGLAEMEGDERDAAKVSRTIQPLSSALEDFFEKNWGKDFKADFDEKQLFLWWNSNEQFVIVITWLVWLKIQKWSHEAAYFTILSTEKICFGIWLMNYLKLFVTRDI